MQRIPFYKYSERTNSWLKHAWFRYDTRDNELSDQFPIESGDRQLTMLTFNILFDIYKAQDTISQSKTRYKYQIAQFQSMNLDIICLQEVTASFLALMEADEWIRKTYYVSHCVSDKSCAVRIMPYGNIILSKYPFAELYQYAYPSLRDKSCTIASFKCKGRGHSSLLTVVSCHLKADDAYDWTHLRRKQLSELLNQLDNHAPYDSQINDIFICGDFNFQSQEDEQSMPQTYVDVWPHINPNEPGITFDSRLNTMIPEIFPCRLPCSLRFDRCFMKETNQTWRIASASLEFNRTLDSSKEAGHSSTPNNQSLLFPSDHFAVKFTIDSIA